MHVKRTIAAYIKKPRREEQAVRGHYDRIRAQCTDFFEIFRRAFEAAGLEDPDATPLREALHRTRCEPQAATGWSIGLCENQRHLVAGAY
jgi:hypothetical protein